MADALDTANPADAAIAERLREVLGDLFAGRVASDAAWAREVLGLPSGS
jgi:transcription initiation factor TFIID subunit 6